MRLRGRRGAVALATVGVLIGILVGALAVQATVILPKPKLTNLAKSEAVRGAPGRELKLTRVDVPAAAELPPHRHLGTQIARIVKGTLTYTVIKGSVTVRTGAADGSEKVVRKIKAGQTGKIRTGQWIVEQPNVHHFARNLGPDPVVIYLATLFPKGAPASVPVANP
jgi:quercetin dioxygenase-like cupin family protein